MFYKNYIKITVWKNLAYKNTLKTKEKCAPNYVGIKMDIWCHTITLFLVNCELSFVGYIKTPRTKASVTHKIAH